MSDLCRYCGYAFCAAEDVRLRCNGAKETAALLDRQQELLALVARISQSTPLDSEVSEALNQRGVLLAEIGTLRAELATAKREIERLKALAAERALAAGTEEKP